MADVSSSPKGEPWHFAVPHFDGEPKPMVVLQAIRVGFLDFCAFLIAFSIAQ